MQVVYLSSRNYAGYAESALNPEPYAYEGGFSTRWLIQKQIDGDSKLNADPASGAVVAPVLLWGPYTWADGGKGRKIDSLTYERKDFAGDGTHPSAWGQEKVTDLLLKFFKTDPMGGKWFTGKAK